MSASQSRYFLSLLLGCFAGACAVESPPVQWPAAGGGSLAGYIDACPTSATKHYQAVYCSVALNCTFSSGCCGQTYSHSCSCSPGELWQCSYDPDDDTCWGAQYKCSQGCDSGEFLKNGKCTPCGSIVASYTSDLAVALASAATCAADSDCGAVALGACATPCLLPVQLGAEATLSAAVAKVAAEHCPAPSAISGCLATHGCQTGQPRCVKGQCKLVPPCSAGFEPVGSACNDGNACTEGETCTAPGKCTGTAKNCDDGSPCTKDHCQPVSGCVHTPVAGVCPLPGGLCQISGQCVGGSCSAAGFPGQKWELPALAAPRLAVDADASGSAVALWHQNAAQPTAVAARFSGSGAKLWQWSASAAPTYAAAVAASDDGGAALVLRPSEMAAGPWSVVRLGSAGEVLWQTAPVSAPSSQLSHAIHFTATGVAVVGSASSAAAIPMTLRTWSATGAKMLALDLAATAGYGPAALVAASPGGLWLATTKPVSPIKSDVRLLSVASSGLILIDKSLPQPDKVDLTAISGLPDGGALIAVSRAVYSARSKGLSLELWHLSANGALVAQTPTSLRTLDFAGTGDGLRAAGSVDFGSSEFWTGAVTAGGAPEDLLTTPPGLWPLTNTAVAAIPGQKAFWALGSNAGKVSLLRVGNCP